MFSVAIVFFSSPSSVPYCDKPQCCNSFLSSILDQSFPSSIPSTARSWINFPKTQLGSCRFLALPFCDGVHGVYVSQLGIPGLTLVWHSYAFSDDFFCHSPLCSRDLYSTQNECLESVSAFPTLYLCAFSFSSPKHHPVLHLFRSYLSFLLQL